MHNNIVQQHFWHKYSFQRVPNKVEKLRKFWGVGGYDQHHFRGGGDPKQKCPPCGGEGAYGYFVELHIVLLHEIFTFIVCKWLG